MTNTSAAIQHSSWKAELALGFSVDDTKTILSSRKQRGPLAVQRTFYPEDDVCHTYILHPPGGVVGGDLLKLQALVENNASVLLTTPGATKFYRSDKRLAVQHQHFNVTQGCLEWLPQENIFFPGAHCALSTSIELETDASFIGWEINCLGRPAISESFDTGSLQFKTTLYRNQQPLYIDLLRLQDKDDLQGATSLRDMSVLATLIATPANEQALLASRHLCESKLQYGHAGATLYNNVLVLRYLGNSTAEAHRLFRQTWREIRPLINDRPATTPRIWAT